MADRPDDKRVVGVYPDEATAQEAARDAEQAGGRDVRVGAPEDEVSSLLGEMREETEQAWGGPAVGIYTKEMARSVPKWTVLGAVAGAVVALGLNFLGGGDLEIGARLIIAGLVGAVAGGTIGFLIGGGFFDPRRKAASNLAAEKGVVVGATEIDATDEALAVHRPIREDVVDPEGPVDTVTTEDRQESEQHQQLQHGEKQNEETQRQNEESQRR
jgi:hypothetical protein